MSDLIERARKEASRGELDGDATDALLLELADEIERLRASLIEMSANYILQCRIAGSMPDSGVIERQRAALEGK